MRDEVDPSTSWACIACGCTNDRACRGGCCWIAPNKCSTCFDDDGASFANGSPENDSFGVELCPASEVPAPHAPLFASPTVCYCARCHVELAA